MVFWIATFVLGAPLALALHEASHAIVVKLRGGEILSFRPFPGKIDGRWWLGYVRYTNPPPDRTTKWQHGSPLLISAPLAVGFGLGALWWTPLLGLAAWEAIDFIWWWRGYFETAFPVPGRWAQPVEKLDGYKYKHFRRG